MATSQPHHLPTPPPSAQPFTVKHDGVYKGRFATVEQAAVQYARLEMGMPPLVIKDEVTRTSRAPSTKSAKPTKPHASKPAPSAATKDASTQGKDSFTAKGPFTDEEDDAVLRGVERHGVGKWTLIISEDARLAQRNGDSVRGRYKTLTKKSAGG